MIAAFTRSTTFVVGTAQVPFYLHTELVERTCHHLRFQHGQIGAQGVVALPLVDPDVFRLFAGFIHGIYPNITWSIAEDRRTLVDLAVIAHWLGTYSLQYWLASIIVDEGRLIDRVKYCPGFEALQKAYDEETTDSGFFLRTLFADCYAIMGDTHHFTDLIVNDRHKILDDEFWPDFSYRCGEWRNRDNDAWRKSQCRAPRWSMKDYFEGVNPQLLRGPQKMSRQGVEISNACYYRFNRICIADGKAPLLIHQSLTDIRGDINNDVPPHDITLPSGWRNAALIYLEWLYHGRVMWEADHLKDLILAYCIDLPRTTHFKNVVISAIVSWCARYAIVPSDADIVLAYLWTSRRSPLRMFMAAWAYTHLADVTVDLNKMPKDIRDDWQADLAHEHRLRSLSVDIDLHDLAAGGEWKYDLIEGPCFWNGDDLTNEDGLVVGPYYFDNVCKRFHIHDKIDDKRILGCGGRGGRECRDFHGPSEQLPYIIMYLPDGLNKSLREGWFDDLDLHIPEMNDPNHWALNCHSNKGWPAYHRRMLLGNCEWLCRRTRSGTAYFLRHDEEGRVHFSHVDPRNVKWVRGEDPWGGNFPVVPSDGIPEYAWEEHFEMMEFDEEWAHLRPDASVDGAFDERKAGFASGDPNDNLDNFSLTEGDFSSDDEDEEDKADKGAGDDDASQDGSEDNHEHGSDNEDEEDKADKGAGDDDASQDGSEDNHEHGSDNEDEEDSADKGTGDGDGNQVKDEEGPVDESAGDNGDHDGSGCDNEQDPDSKQDHPEKDHDEGHSLSDLD